MISTTTITTITHSPQNEEARTMYACMKWWEKQIEGERDSPRDKAISIFVSLVMSTRAGHQITHAAFFPFSLSFLSLNVNSQLSTLNSEKRMKKDSIQESIITSYITLCSRSILNTKQIHDHDDKQNKSIQKKTTTLISIQCIPVKLIHSVLPMYVNREKVNFWDNNNQSINQ